MYKSIVISLKVPYVAIGVAPLVKTLAFFALDQSFRNPFIGCLDLHLFDARFVIAIANIEHARVIQELQVFHAIPRLDINLPNVTHGFRV